jgi:IclR family transcriptional regulator, acetate operon repressor
MNPPRATLGDATPIATAVATADGAVDSGKVALDTTADAAADAAIDGDVDGAVDTVQPPRPGKVQAVDRAFEVLETLADAGGQMSLKDLTDATKLPMPTIHRLLRTLLRHGYVRQLPSRWYALGPRLINLGVSASSMLSDWAKPWLTGLVDNLGETANLCMLDGDRATYVAQIPSRHTMRTFTEVGRRVYLHSTGVGKALLAQLDDDQVRELIIHTGMPPATANTITDPAALAAELTSIRETGYAIDEGEQEIGVRCVAVPIPGAPTPIAISVSGPAARLTLETVDRAVPLLRTAADGLARDLLARRTTA